jgi:hypothetical protein
MKYFKRLFVGPALLFSMSVSAQSASEETPIADMLDSLLTRKMFETAFQRPVFPKNNKYKFAQDSVPRYDDYTYQARLARLDALSPLDLVYNPHVKAFIDLYTIRKRESVSRMMGMTQLYYPMFEEVLDKYNIPLELKHLMPDHGPGRWGSGSSCTLRARCSASMSPLISTSAVIPIKQRLLPQNT